MRSTSTGSTSAIDRRSHGRRAIERGGRPAASAHRGRGGTRVDLDRFRRHGFNGTSLKQIGAAAEATTGSIYHFFPDGKDQLAREVIEVSGEAYRQLFVMITSEAPIR